MTKQLKKILLVTMTIVLVIPFSVFANPQSPDQVVEFTILHTNDFHGRLETDSAGRGGAALLSTAIGEIRTEVGADNVALLDAGDVALAGPPISQLVGGESTIEVFNALGYDLSVLGNHEFDMDQDHLEDMIDWANFPWLGANVYLEGGNLGDFPTWMDDPPYITLTLGTGADTVDIGVIGLANEGTPSLTLAGTTDGLVFGDPTETILHYYDTLEPMVDIIIVVAHIGTDDETAGSTTYEGLVSIAQNLQAAGKDVPLIIGGHQHQALMEPVIVGDTYIVQAGNYGRYLGRVDMTYDTGTGAVGVVSTELIPILSLAVAPETGFAPDPAIQAIVDFWADFIGPIVNAPVAETEIPLTRDYNNESVMGNIVTDSMLWKANQLDDEPVEIAFTNPGGLRADIPEDPDADFPYTITWGDTFNVLPFMNTLVIMDLTGQQIQEILNQSAALDRGILQVSGLSHYWYNSTRSDAANYYGAYDIMVEDVPLDVHETYRVVTNNFLAGGGDFWTTFLEGENVNDTFFDMQEGFVQYLEMIDPVEQTDIEMGRITYQHRIWMPLIIHGALPEFETTE
jgi:2',3'-cyclic-nucleotide 2'-phosphodiesterase (5'-nucleotidase family)